MKRIGFLFVCLTVFAMRETDAEDLPAVLYTDFEISHGSVIHAEYDIKDSIEITNRGTLSGEFFADSVEFSIRNSGIADGTIFKLSGNAKIFQKISSNDEVSRLNVIGGTYVPIIQQDFSGRVDASTLIALYNNVRVDKSNLDIDVELSELNSLAALLDISTDASLNLIISNYGDEYFDKPSFSGTVSYWLPEPTNPMFVYTEKDGEIKRARNTDYTVVLSKNDKRAVFLNNVRILDPANETLEKLDNAGSIAEMETIMGKSMFFNPIVLNDGIEKTVTRFSPISSCDLGMFFGTQISADNIVTGTSISFGHSGNKLTASGELFAGKAEEDDDYKQGEAVVYAPGAYIKYGTLGIGAKYVVADWDKVLIFSDGETKTSAKSRLFYTFLETSPKIWFFSPVVRANYVKSSIEEFSDEHVYVSYGAVFNIADEIMGIKENYAAYAMKNRDEIDVGINADWHFVDDGAMLSARLGIRNLAIEFRALF